MIQMIVAGTIIFFAVILLVVGKILNRSVARFENGKIAGTAQVVGYDREGNTSWHTLFVKVLELNDGKIYNCSQGLVKKSDYPVGKIVDVEYVSYKTMGMDIVEVRLANPNRKPNNFGRIINKIAVILLVISAIIMVSGLTQIIK